MFKLNPQPTFTAPVALSVPGLSEPLEVLFTFKHKGKDALGKWVATATQKMDAEALGEVVCGWAGVKDEDGKVVGYRGNNSVDYALDGSPLDREGLEPMPSTLKLGSGGLTLAGAGLNAPQRVQTLIGLVEKSRRGVVAVFGDRTYHNTVYASGSLYENAVTGRAYLAASDRLEVSGSSDTNGNGTYLYNGITLRYTNTNNWYFIKSGGLWLLRNASDVTQATQTSAGDLADPQLVTTWNGVLSAGTVTRTGAAWTITDGGLV
jgi:hypothetical protein